jgi:hypothetical protein
MSKRTGRSPSGARDYLELFKAPSAEFLGSPCFQISLDGGTVTLHLGKTLVVTTVTATMEAPAGGR